VNFYDLDAEAQQRQAFAHLTRYLRDYVGPFHPYLRKRYREAGIALDDIRTIEDFRRLPILEKDDLRSDPQAFVLRPNSPGGPPFTAGMETEPLPRRTIARYAAQAIVNTPTDHSFLVRRSTLRDRIRRRGLQEWLPVHFHVSGGSTGEPTPVSYTSYDLHHVVTEMASLAIDHKHPKPGYLPFDWTERKLVLFPGAPHVAFYGAVLTKVLVGSPSFETFGGAVIPTDRQIALFARGGFSTLVAIPSYLVHWLRRALVLQREGVVGQLTSLRRAVLGAEPVSEELRELIRSLARDAGAESVLRIVQCVGMTEMKWTFFECSERSGLHLNPKYYYWELLHPETREPVSPGEPGVLVFTHVGWRGTVLVRYWTGDLVKGGMQWTRCEHCGYTFPRVFPPICRAVQDFTKLKGARVDLPELAEVVRATPGVRSFQVTLDSEDAATEFSRDLLVITVVAEAGHDPATIDAVLRGRVKAATEVSPDRVVFESDPDVLDRRLFATPSMKAQYVVERRSHRQ
jgi:phenylacetate-CoA ligase